MVKKNIFKDFNIFFTVQFLRLLSRHRKRQRRSSSTFAIIDKASSHFVLNFLTPVLWGWSHTFTNCGWWGWIPVQDFGNTLPRPFFTIPADWAHANFAIARRTVQHVHMFDDDDVAVWHTYRWGAYKYTHALTCIWMCAVFRKCTGPKFCGVRFFFRERRVWRRGNWSGNATIRNEL